MESICRVVRSTIVWLWAFLWFCCNGPFALGQPAAAGRASQQSQGHPDSVLLLLKREHAEAVQKNDMRGAGITLQQMGRICFNQGHYAQALDFYLNADKLFDDLKAADLLAGNLNEMGELYYFNKQPLKARTLFNKALSLYREKQDRKGQAVVLGNIGRLYEKYKRYDSAFYYQNQALNCYRGLGNKTGKARIYENLGSIYEDLGKYDSAYVCFHTSLQLYQKDRNESGSIEVVNNLGDILRKTGKYKESIALSKRAFTLATQTGNMYQLASACRDLGKAYQLMNQLDSAYYYLELSRRYSLDVYSRESINQTAFLQVLYDMNKKSEEIVHLNAIRKTNRIIALAVGTVLVLLVILAFMIFSRQRLKIRDQRILAGQKESIYEAQKELMELEIQNKRLQEESLKHQLDLKGKELSTHTLNLIRNNQLLESLRNTLQEMIKDEKRDQKKQMQQLIQQINQSFNHDQHWKEFTAAFEQVHQSFFDSLKRHNADLTAADLRLIALLKINLNSRDISTLLGISQDSLRVARHRLRKKLNVEQGDNLASFIQRI